MSALLRQEWLKLSTLRSTRWAALAAVLLTAAFAWLGGQAARLVEDSAGRVLAPAELLSLMLRTNPPVLIAVGVLGAAAVTADVRHRVVVPTLLQHPRRVRVWAAKAIVVASLSAGVALAGVAAAVAVLVSTSSWGVSGASAGALVPAAAYVGLAVGWSLVGLATGAVVGSQAGAVALLLLLPDVVEPVARVALTTAGGASATFAEFLPFGAGSALITPPGGTDGVLFVARELPAVASLAVFVVFVALVLAAGMQAFCRRDLA